MSRSVHMMEKTSTEPAYTIKEAAQQSGLPADTIRYYEKIGLLPRADRKESGHRAYRKESIDTMKLIVCLKKTGMPLEEMKPFLEADLGPDADYPELYELMLDHRERIMQQIASLQQVVAVIDDRLAAGVAGRGVCSTAAVPKRTVAFGSLPEPGS
ncbi:MerR family transcriptional regulator [Paenibacillus sp. 1P07SE]|uniref:MerR family transcriptional regulator n=1 Tax=Paenibacillus sp. 1P07SE TaxID=3132209 RepID=UPI0039A490C7